MPLWRILFSTPIKREFLWTDGFSDVSVADLQNLYSIAKYALTSLEDELFSRLGRLIDEKPLRNFRGGLESSASNINQYGLGGEERKLFFEWESSQQPSGIVKILRNGLEPSLPVKKKEFEQRAYDEFLWVLRTVAGPEYALLAFCVGRRSARMNMSQRAQLIQWVMGNLLGLSCKALADTARSLRICDTGKWKRSVLIHHLTFSSGEIKYGVHDAAYNAQE
jgi:hypothetical protein